MMDDVLYNIRRLSAFLFFLSWFLACPIGLPRNHLHHVSVLCVVFAYPSLMRCVRTPVLDVQHTTHNTQHQNNAKC